MRLLESNRSWVVITALSGILAPLIHLFGQTAGFTHDYFSEPNYYHTWPNNRCPRFDQITHVFSSYAVCNIIQNFNLPGRFYFKDVFSFLISVGFQLLWEFAEWLVAPWMGWVHIDPMDTIFDLKNNSLGAIASLYLYHKVVLAGVD